MPDFQVDLSNCDREPIHIPGQIQSHGFLVVIDPKNIICFCSENIHQFIGSTASALLGCPLDQLESLIGNQHQPDFITQLLILAKHHNNFDQINPFKIQVGGIDYLMIVSTAPDYFMLEFEQAAVVGELDIQKMIGRSISEMLKDKNLQNLLNNTVMQVKKIIQYDRIMVYRFAEDGHGEVVAEAKNEQLDSWLGLHYPASDIPKQARELYKHNFTRLIADVQTTPSKIAAVESDLNLDMTNAQLRAVSPIHIQYLKNMGVASSFSISLMYKKELWGLVACHNYTARFIDYTSRESAKLIGQVLSSALEFRQDEENQQLHEGYNIALEKLAKLLQKNTSIEEALTHKKTNILSVTHASGAILIYDKKRIRLGITPDDEQMDNLLKWIQKNNKKSLFHTCSLSSVYPEAFPYRDAASGMLVSVLSRELKEYVIWFKPEKTQTVKWAGNPEKPVEQDTNGLMQISPRHSFEVWSQTVAGRSDNWNREEISSIIRLKEEITYAINYKAYTIRILNEKLRHAYEELDAFSYTISHDLKNPLAAIKIYVELLRRDQSIGERGQLFLKRIDEGSAKMNLMINEVLGYSRIGRSAPLKQTVDAKALINDIVTDLTLIHRTRILTITIGETPSVQADPIMLMQVFSNLIGNAVKYSQGSYPAEVHIEGIENEREVRYTIKDNGIGIAVIDLPKIFELFNRMQNVKDIEGTGVGLAIVKRIVDKHQGKIWAESELGVGSTFYVTFDK